MSATSFNNLSEFVGQQPEIKKKVLLQSYFYKCVFSTTLSRLSLRLIDIGAWNRIVADMEGNLRRAMPVFHSPSTTPTPSEEVKDIEVSEAKSDVLQAPCEAQRIAQTLRDIEALRLSTRERLKVSHRH